MFIFIPIEINKNKEIERIEFDTIIRQVRIFFKNGEDFRSYSKKDFDESLIQIDFR